MRNKAVKIGLAIYLILFAYVIIFEEFNAMSTFARVFFIVTPFVMYISLKSFKKL